MRPDDDCIGLLKSFERFVPRPYLCAAGKPTIGYGTRYYLDGRAVAMRDAPIDRATAEHILRETVARMWGTVQGMIGRAVLQRECNALALLVYNIGETAFRKSAMLRFLRAGDKRAAAEEFEKWNKVTVDGLKRASNGLTARRKLERRIYERG